jgi:hypothetical protein
MPSAVQAVDAHVFGIRNLTNMLDSSFTTGSSEFAVMLSGLALAAAAAAAGGAGDAAALITNYACTAISRIC